MTIQEFNNLPLSEREKSENWPRDGKGQINLRYANLCDANLCNANLCNASLSGANLSDANLRNASLSGASLSGANLRYADLSGANLCNANLCNANLCNANLCNASLSGANLSDANLRNASLSNASLSGAKGLIKLMGVVPGNYYFKRIEWSLANQDYFYRIGLNELREGETFAADERVLCSYPGFHFSSQSWADREYGSRFYLAKIRIPEDAQINEPWATDGKASADKIEIVQFWRDGKDVTEELRSIKTDGRGKRL